MSSFKDLCEKYFGTSDFYEVLNVERNASDKQIKKAYHQLSLLVHPDRVPDNQKAIATEKFKVLGNVHSVLQDKKKRRCYDDTGVFDEENNSSFNWMEYWRAIFKNIDRKDIEDFEKDYIGSAMELRDIKKAYVSSKGNMDLILELVPFSNCDSEPRILEIVRDLVDDGEVEEYSAFFNESERKKIRRRKKWEKEQKEVESIDLSSIEKQIKARQEERIQDFANLISSIESKYATATKKRKSLTNGNPITPTAAKKRTRSNK